MDKMKNMGDLAAEQRAIVAHSASYGYRRPYVSKAPAGAIENHPTKIQTFRSIRNF
ncbi:MAG TPA: hypothetical protein VGI03_12145 [Verrucomicrobiae bacterium]